MRAEKGPDQKFGPFHFEENDESSFLAGHEISNAAFVNTCT